MSGERLGRLVGENLPPQASGSYRTRHPPGKALRKGFTESIEDCLGGTALANSSWTSVSKAKFDYSQLLVFVAGKSGRIFMSCRRARAGGLAHEIGWMVTRDVRVVGDPSGRVAET
jgi:hypothetical protein